jgi:EpsI family protein
MLLGLAVLAGYTTLAPTIATREWAIPDRPSLAGYPLRFGGYSGVPRSLDGEVVEKLGATDHLYVDYVDGAGQQLNLWVAYNAHQGDGNLLHSPRTCLPGSGWEYERLERRAIAMSETRSGGMFHVNEAIAVRGTARIALVYWMEARGRQVASETWNKLYTFYDSLFYRRSDGALVRVLTEVRSGETDQDALRRVYAFIDASFDHLRPYVGR